MNNISFENGVRVSPVMVQVFESSPGDPAQPFESATQTLFFNWLNGPSEKYAKHEPPITNLAAWIYGKRVDLQQVFPGMEGPMRIAFIQWYLIHAQREYDLDDAFVKPMQQSVLNWAIQRSPSDPLGAKGIPMVTNLGVYLHATQLNLQKRFPDIFGVHRVDFAVWYLYDATLERCARRDLILPVVTSWAQACTN